MASDKLDLSEFLSGLTIKDVDLDDFEFVSITPKKETSIGQPKTIHPPGKESHIIGENEVKKNDKFPIPSFFTEPTAEITYEKVPFPGFDEIESFGSTDTLTSVIMEAGKLQNAFLTTPHGEIMYVPVDVEKNTPKTGNVKWWLEILKLRIKKEAPTRKTMPVTTILEKMTTFPMALAHTLESKANWNLAEQRWREIAKGMFPVSIVEWFNREIDQSGKPNINKNHNGVMGLLSCVQGLTVIVVFVQRINDHQGRV